MSDDDVRMENNEEYCVYSKAGTIMYIFALTARKKTMKVIRREWLKQFIKENLFTTSTIYTNSLVSVACDVTEINIFIALMHLFGIKICLEK